jgi:hypothetical protein
MMIVAIVIGLIIFVCFETAALVAAHAPPAIMGLVYSVTAIGMCEAIVCTFGAWMERSADKARRKRDHMPYADKMAEAARQRIERAEATEAAERRNRTRVERENAQAERVERSKRARVERHNRAWIERRNRRRGKASEV